jgi:hypothetical protein
MKTLPNTDSGLLVLAEKAAQGAAEYGATIGLLQNTEANIRTDRQGLLTSRDNYQAGNVTLKANRAVVRSVTQTGRSALKIARDVLKAKLGGEYNANWNITGLTSSLMIPQKVDRVQALLESFKNYLATHEEIQVDALDVTAARMESLLGSLVAARRNVALQVAQVANLLAARERSAARLRLRVRSLLSEIELQIGDLDPRWRGFGFNPPGLKRTPDAPQGVSAVLVGPTAASIKWKAAPRAEHYRVWKKVTGVDEEFVAAGSPADIDFTLEGLPSNATIEIAVSAVNNGGESARSQVVTLVTH